MNRTAFTIVFGMSIAIAVGSASPAQVGDGDDFTDILTDHVLVYRGELWYRNSPVEGPVDLEFRVFASDTDVVPIAPTILAEQWPVAEGRVLVELDFGDPALFEDGAWLEVTVDETILLPRQFIPPSGMTLFASDVSREHRAAATSDGGSMVDQESPGDPPEDEAADAAGSAASPTPRRAPSDSSSSISSPAAAATSSDAKQSGDSGASIDPTQPDQSHESAQGINLAGECDAWTCVDLNIVWTNRRVGIGRANPTFALDVRGSQANRLVRIVNTSATGAARALFSQSRSSSGRGIEGVATSPTGETTGVWAQSKSSEGRGLYGFASARTGQNFGVYGQSDSTSGFGVFGWASANSGITYGVYGQSDSTSGAGVLGWATASSGTTHGVQGRSESTSGRGVRGVATASSGTTYGVFGQSSSASGRGVFGQATASGGGTYGVYGESVSTSGRGVYGLAGASSGDTYGVFGESRSTSGRGVFGWARAASGFTNGVAGSSHSSEGVGVYGLASALTGATSGAYGRSHSAFGRGVYGEAAATIGVNYGVYGRSNSTDGFDFYADGVGTDYGSSSSIRWKRSIVNINDALSKLSQLRGVYFDWDEEHGGHHDVGMIAEEVGAVLPEIVNYEENGVDAIGMDYSKLTPLLVEAIKSLRAEKEQEIRALQRTVEKQELVISELLARVRTLEASR